VTPAADAIAKPATTRRRLRSTYKPHVPEYQASGSTGPKTHVYQLSRTVAGEGIDEEGTQPTVQAICQIKTMSAGTISPRPTRPGQPARSEARSDFSVASGRVLLRVMDLVSA
jgi:hypothetical protein